MVKFYVPWCTHCQKLAPEYSALAKKMDSDKNGKIVIAECDVVVSKEVAEKENIHGYPTIKYYFHGFPILYRGERTAVKMEEWLLKRTEERAVEITTLEKVKEIERARLAVLLYLPNKNSAAIHALNALALTYDNVSFYYTYVDDVQSYYELDQQNSLIVFRSFDEGKKILSNENELSYDLMRQFFESVRLPIVTEFNDEAASDIFAAHTNSIIFFAENEESPQYKIFYEMAKSKKYSYKFVRSSINEGVGRKLAEFCGLHKGQTNQVRAIKFVGNEIQKYKLADVTDESFAKFVEDYHTDKLPRYLKSQAPVENDTSPVKTIVSENFEELVLNNDKYVLVEGYAPWCSHCKKLEPIYVQLAEKVKHVPNLVIAKYDGSANEHPSFPLKGFPTIKFYMRGMKSNPIEYKQPRDLSSFLAFVQSNMGNDWEVENVLDDSL
jgi:protein disulfide-isomerase A1